MTSERANPKVQVWEFLKIQRMKGKGEQRHFSGQSVTGSVLDEIDEELWRLTTSGVLRVMGPNYSLTAFGTAALDDDSSPLRSPQAFTDALDAGAPDLDEDARGYLVLALDCFPVAKPAALALVRVALELDLGSFIEEFIGRLQPKDIKKLRDRNIRNRMDGIVEQVRSRNLWSEDEIRFWQANMETCRAGGNAVLHPRGKEAIVDAEQVVGAFAAFRGAATAHSRLRAIIAGPASAQSPSSAI